MAESEAPLKTYRGNCHCGAFVYEVTMPEIKKVGECDCSICVKKGYIYEFVDKSKFKVVKGSEDELTSYTFGPKTMVHKFCPHCGNSILVRQLTDQLPPEYDLGFNLHTIQGLNTWEVERRQDHYKNVGDPYVIPEHKGARPSAEVEGGQTYNGSCHCGAVTLHVNSKPIDDTYEGLIVECNCSVCERGAYIWVYPPIDQVVLAARNEADIGRYQFNRRILSKTFCRTCGVLMTNEWHELPDEEVAALTDVGRAWYERVRKIHAVNLRVLNDFDLAKIKHKIRRQDTNTEGYENP